MSRTLIIQVRPLLDVAGDFKKAYRAAHGRRPVKRHEGVYFTSLDAVRNFLTKERIALLRAVRDSRPRSIYELAKIVDRDLKNVQQDMALLERHGLVRFSEKRRGQKGKIRIPRAPFDEIALRIAI